MSPFPCGGRKDSSETQATMNKNGLVKGAAAWPWLSCALCSSHHPLWGHRTFLWDHQVSPRHLQPEEQLLAFLALLIAAPISSPRG